MLPAVWTWVKGSGACSTPSHVRWAQITRRRGHVAGQTLTAPRQRVAEAAAARRLTWPTPRTSGRENRHVGFRRGWRICAPMQAVRTHSWPPVPGSTHAVRLDKAKVELEPTVIHWHSPARPPAVSRDGLAPAWYLPAPASSSASNPLAGNAISRSLRARRGGYSRRTAGNWTMARPNRHAPRSPARYLTAEQLASHLGVSRQWVYEHKLELGYVPLGNGPKARLRFDPLLAESVFEDRLRHMESHVTRRGRPRRRQDIAATSYRIEPKSAL
jgi:hypothetical protein